MNTVKIVNESKFDLPNYATPGSAGVDLKANIDTAIEIKPLERTIVPTGLFMQIPQGMEGQVRPRSGLAAKHGISVCNSPGTIDSDYTGEIKIILVNLSNTAFLVNPGERIAQMVFAKCEQVDFLTLETVGEFESTERGSGGFGSTGTK